MLRLRRGYNTMPPPVKPRMPVEHAMEMNRRVEDGSGGRMIAYLKCMLVVAAATGLPPRVLPVIQTIEGGAVGMVHPNDNGTADLGVMQVNTLWVPALATRAQLSEAQTRNRLIDDPCFNIAAAALILRGYLVEAHGNLPVAVGYYHSHTPALKSAYTELAEQTARRLFAGGTP
jgi:hypothetical protein